MYRGVQNPAPTPGKMLRKTPGVGKNPKAFFPSILFEFFDGESIGKIRDPHDPEQLWLPPLSRQIRTTGMGVFVDLAKLFKKGRTGFLQRHYINAAFSLFEKAPEASPLEKEYNV